MVKNKVLFALVYLILISCRQHKSTAIVNDRQSLISYLKSEFKILPAQAEFDSLYLIQLKKSNISLHTDSLISSCLLVSRNNQFNIDLVEFSPDYDYQDSIRKLGYSINLIRNNITGKIYLDYIDWHSRYFSGDFCFYVQIQVSPKIDIPQDQFVTYSSIKTNRRFAKNATYPSKIKQGIVEYLNEEFRFEKIEKDQLDSLFKFYDGFHYPYLKSASVISDPKDLIRYLSAQAKNIRKRYHTEDDLIYLKDQIDLLIIRSQNCDNKMHFQWIYELDNQLFERMVTISGNEESFFEYKMEEKIYCFL